MVKTAKKGNIGRPSGEPKKPVNIYILETTVKKLKKLSRKKGKTISGVVETAVDLYEATEQPQD